MGVILVFAAIIAWEVPRLYREKMWRELAVFFVLVIAGIVLSFGQIFDWPLPNPTSILEAVFRPVSKFIEDILVS